MSQKKMLNLQDSLQTIKDPNLRSWHPFTQIKNCAVSNNWRLKRKLNSWKWNCRIVSWKLPGLQLYLKLILTDQQCRAQDLTLSSRGWSRWRLVVGWVRVRVVQDHFFFFLGGVGSKILLTLAPPKKLWKKKFSFKIPWNSEKIEGEKNRRGGGQKCMRGRH